MTNNKVDIWSRGSKSEGWGHLVRCQTIASYLLKKDNIKVRFFAETDDYVKSKIDNCGIDIIFFSINSNPNKYLSGGTICIIDRYIYKKKDIIFLKKKYKKIIIFDELQKIGFLNILRIKDVVVRAQLINKQNTQKAKCKFLLGLEHFIINKKKNYVKRDNKKIDILIMLGGGTNYFENYLNIAINIKNLIRKSMKILFILGYGHNKKQIEKIKSISSNYDVKGFVKDPLHYMIKSKIGIMSGGYSKYEAAFARLPSIIVPVKKHQVSISKEFCVAGGGLFVKSKNNYELKKVCNNLINNKKLRIKVSKSSGNLIDGLALDRIYPHIKSI